jgi:hypothetical protein
VLFDVAFEPAFANFEVGVFFSFASAAAARLACRAAFEAEIGGMMAARSCVLWETGKESYWWVEILKNCGADFSISARSAGSSACRYLIQIHAAAIDTSRSHIHRRILFSVRAL